MFRKLAILIGAAVADPCTDLCKWDGPEICTGGSWTKSNGYCHGYLYRGDPVNKDYCYHTALTARSCPSNGVGLRAQEAALIVNSFHRPAMRSTTVRPSSVAGTTAVPDPLFEVLSDIHGLKIGFDKTNGRFFQRNIRFYNLQDSQQPGAMGRYMGIAQRVLGSKPNDNSINNLLKLRNVHQVPPAYSKAFVTAMLERHGSIDVICKHPVTKEPIAYFAAESDRSVVELVLQVPDWGQRICTALMAIRAELESAL
jgi:hypothetical protein